MPPRVPRCGAMPRGGVRSDGSWRCPQQVRPGARPDLWPLGATRLQTDRAARRGLRRSGPRLSLAVPVGARARGVGGCVAVAAGVRLVDAFGALADSHGCDVGPLVGALRG